MVTCYVMVASPARHVPPAVSLPPPHPPPHSLRNRRQGGANPPGLKWTPSSMPHLHLDQYNLDQFRPQVKFPSAPPFPSAVPSPPSRPLLNASPSFGINTFDQFHPPGKISFRPSPPSPTPPTPPFPLSPPFRRPLPSPPQCLSFIWDQYIRSIPPPPR